MKRPAFRLALIDLDGTLYVGKQPVEGAPEAVERIRARGLTVRFTTNTDSMPPDAVVAKLNAFGIAARPGDVVTPLALAQQLFADHRRARVLTVAAPPVREFLRDHLAMPGDQPTHVLVADPSFGAGYAELDAAFRAVRGGARLVATQTGRWVRREDGDHLDTGGWVRLLEYATETDALVLGKPSLDFFRLALEGAGVPAAETVVVGDDRASDIAGGRAAGAHTVLVGTGKGGGAAGPDPDVVIASIADLPALLDAR